MTRREFGTAMGTLGASILTFSTGAAETRNRELLSTRIRSGAMYLISP
jgi:hypothetical protein